MEDWKSKNPKSKKTASLPGEREVVLISEGFIKNITGLHVFSHEAMAAVFEILILHPDKNYAAQAAADAFALLDKLDGELGRFHSNGDIARINNMTPGQALSAGLDAFLCLMKSREMNRITKGAFDVTAGWLKDVRSTDNKKEIEPVPVGMHHLLFDETQWTITKDAPVRIDMGAIGKGYAADRMGTLLREWELDNFLIHGGHSSVQAMGGLPGIGGWPVSVRHPLDQDRLLAAPVLSGRGMGGSGIGQGPHIIHPGTGKPADKVLAAWAVADDAAAADAVSTALMIMEKDEADAMLEKERTISALTVYRGNGVVSRWRM